MIKLVVARQAHQLHLLNLNMLISYCVVVLVISA